MGVRPVKRKVLLAFTCTTLAVVTLEWFMVRAAWPTLPGATSSAGCACAPGFTYGWQPWTIIGLASLFALGWIAGVVYVLATLGRTRRVVRQQKAQCGAFTFGLLRPQMVVCAHCLATLSSEELQAIRAHERHHVQNRDPLKFLILDTLRVTFFFVPLLRTLSALYRTAAEIEADEQVANRGALGSALLRFTEVNLSSLASFAFGLSERIERLVDPHWRLHLALPPRSIVATAALTLSVLGILLARPHSLPSSPRCSIPAAQCSRSVWPGNLDAPGAVYYTESL